MFNTDMQNSATTQTVPAPHSCTPDDAGVCDLYLNNGPDGLGFWLQNWLVEPSCHTLTLYRASADGLSLHEQDLLIQRQLEPRLMKLLCQLTENAGKVVSRDHLIEKLWPRVVVNENSLTRAISDLRKALSIPGEITADGCMELKSVDIKTVPKRGYCLLVPAIAPLTAPLTIQHRANCSSANTDAENEHATAPQTLMAWPVRKLWHSWIPAAAAAFLLALTLTVQMAELRTLAPSTQVADNPAAQLQFDGLVDEVLSSSGFTGQTAAANLNGATFKPETLYWLEDTRQPKQLSVLAPEGDIIAYIENASGISSLKLRPAYGDGESWIAFTTDENIQHLQWSPLGDGVLFTVASRSRESGDNSYLRLMLLDIQTLALHELYRRPLQPAGEESDSSAGKLT